MRHDRLALAFMFVAAVCWLALLWMAVEIGHTDWGRGGHPSNSVVLTLFSLAAAPFFALAGCSYAIAWKAQYAKPMRFAAIVTSTCVLAVGLGFWGLFAPSDISTWRCYPSSVAGAVCPD